MSLKSYTKGSELPPLQDGKLRLYSMRFCPFAQRTRLVLAHKKIPFETINVDLKNKPDWFLEKNPLGKVPMLEHDGKVVYESLICNDYLDDIYPEEKLTPTDPYRRARDNILVETNSKFITMYYKVMGAMQDKDALEDAYKSLEPMEKAIEERGAFYGGDKPAMIDYDLWPWYERIGAIKSLGIELLPEDKFPNLCRWVERMRNLPAVKETLFDNETHIAFYKSYIAGKPDYDMGL